MTDNRPPTATEPTITRAAALVRRMPLRWTDGDHGRGPEEVLQSGFFFGAAECARVLAATGPLRTRAASGFGGCWPLLMSGEWALAPAMPVAVARDPVAGCDGEYRSRAEGIWREAGGVARLYLGSDTCQPAPGEPFDLLWFGEAERFLIRAGILEIEDLFGRLSVPATGERIDRLLCRRRRVDAAVLSALPEADHDSPQVAEVWRPDVLCTGERWRDPAAFLGTRADVSRARLADRTLECGTVGGETVVFEVDRMADGWQLSLTGGSYPFTHFSLERRDGALVMRAVLDSRLDGLAPGLRGRIIFDLRSDLVTLD